MDATFIIYTGIATPTVPITPGQNLQTILQNIDTAIANTNPAPSYTGFNLQCLRDDYTINTTQQFAEAVADFICTLRSDVDTFIGTTYPANLSYITVSIGNLQFPSLTYVPFSIVDTMSITEVWTNVFAGFDGILAALNPSGADWAALSITPPTTVTDAFDDLITYEQTQDSIIAGKQDAIAPFDNSGNCLVTVGGGVSDTIESTVSYLIDYACALPGLDVGSLDFGTCLTPQTSLQDIIQNSLDVTNAILPNVIIAAGTGLSTSSLGPCAGQQIFIDDTWDGLYKVKAHVADTAPDYLNVKLVSINSTIEYTIFGDFLSLDINPSLTAQIGKVKASGADANPADYLDAKIQGGTDPSGVTISTVFNSSTNRVAVIPNVNVNTITNNILDAILTDPDLLAKYCGLAAACAGCLCASIDDLLVARDSVGEFDLSWTPTGGTTTAQISKYRQRGMSSWLTGNSAPTNPMGAMVAASVTSGLLGNMVYQFQVDSDCPGDVGHSNIYEMITYTCGEDLVTISYTDAGGGNFAVNATQNPLPTIDTVQYKIVNTVGPVTIQTISVPGDSPSVSFDPLGTGTYRVYWRYGTLINGVTLYSDDASQVGSWCDWGSNVIIV